MQFQNPTYLWALLAIALPIIIHLFYFKRFKKVYFTNLWMLKEVKDETSMRNRIKDLLVLLMRILAIGMLVMAFVQPIWNKNGKEVDLGKKAVSIYVDNSFSMEAKKDDIILLDIAKQKAKEIVQAYAANDEINILSNELNPTQLRFVTKDQALSLIEEIKISPVRRKLGVIEVKQKELLTANNLKSRSYLLSDFQENIVDLATVNDTSIISYLLMIQSVRENNVSIDSAWLVAPLPMVNEANNLMVRIKNYGDQAVQDLRLNLIQNDQSRPLASYDIAAQESIVDTVKIAINEPGWQSLELTISDYPILFDDKYKVSLEIKEKIDVLSIYETRPSTQISAAYSGVSNVNFEEVSNRQVDYGNINTKELIILNDLKSITSGLTNVLKVYVEGGGNLFILPSEDIDLKSYGELSRALKIDRFTKATKEKKGTSYINLQEFIFNNVFVKRDRNIKMPNTSISYGLINSGLNPREDIIKYRDGNSFFAKCKSGNGNVYLCVSPLDEKYNSLSQNAEIFVPLLYKMGISTIAVDRLSQTVGQDEILKVHGIQEEEQNILKITNKSKNQEFIPGQQVIGSHMVIDMNNQIQKPGFYSLERNGQQLYKWAYNYSRKESKLDYLSEEQLEARYGNRFELLNVKLQEDLTEIIKEENEGLSLWRWALILALVFLGIETLLLRARKT